MVDVTARPLQAGVIIPRSADGDLPGYVPKPILEKAPFVKDKQGMIWQWQDWMHDMGDVLEPCWTAPPGRPIQVATPMDVAAFGSSPRKGSEASLEPATQSPSALSASAKASAVGKRKGGRPKGAPRAPE